MAKYKAKQKSIMQSGKGSGLKHALGGTDWLTILLCLISSVYGLVLVHSCTYAGAAEAERLRFGLFSNDVFMMAGGIVVGLFIAIAISFLDYELILKFWYLLGGACLLLMFLLIPFGVAVNPLRPDAKHWLSLFGLFDFQPSELLKLGFIVSFTWHLHRVHTHINKIKTIALLGLHAFIPFVLVVITGDLGSALVFLFICIGMLFIAGLKLRWFAAVLGLMGAAFPLIWIYFINDFQRNRIYAVYMPGMLEESVLETVLYQQNQAINAIGSGQLFGKGLFNSTVVVPVQSSDMIFSLAGEELGFLGCMGILLCLALVIIRLVLVSRRTRNLRARLLCAGVALMIGSQAAINIGVCLKLLPVTGITLPFFSAGGSSNLSLYLTLGLVLTVYRHQNEHEDTQSYFDYLYS